MKMNKDSSKIQLLGSMGAILCLLTPFKATKRIFFPGKTSCSSLEISTEVSILIALCRNVLAL